MCSYNSRTITQPFTKISKLNRATKTILGILRRLLQPFHSVIVICSASVWRTTGDQVMENE